MTKRHVPWVDIANSIASGEYGWTSCDGTLTEIFNDPPRNQSDTTCNDRQQTLLLLGLLRAVHDLTKATEAVRRSVDRVPAKIEKERLADQLKLAKQETKAAEARERAAEAELRAKFAEPPVMYQCNMEQLEKLGGRIRRVF